MRSLIVIGLTYIMLMFAFAGVYTWLLEPPAFYSETASRDPYLAEHGDSLLVQLHAGLIDAVSEARGDSLALIGSGGWSLDWATFPFFEPVADTNNWIRFRGFVVATKSHPADPRFSVDHDFRELTFRTRVDVYTEGEQWPNQVLKHIFVRGVDGFAIPASEFCPVKPSYYRAEPLDLTPDMFVPISLALQDDLAAYYQAVRGMPSAGPGAFPRMLYLSAATITTLGYGDLVPMTGAARFYTALESVLGIVTAGVFVGRAAWIASSRPRDGGEAVGPSPN